MSNPVEIVAEHIAACTGMDYEGELAPNEKIWCTRKACQLLDVLRKDGWQIVRTANSHDEYQPDPDLRPREETVIYEEWTPENHAKEKS